MNTQQQQFLRQQLDEARKKINELEGVQHDYATERKAYDQEVRKAGGVEEYLTELVMKLNQQKYNRISPNDYPTFKT